MTAPVLRTRSLCPRCLNSVATRIDENGATILAHRSSRESAALCK